MSSRWTVPAVVAVVAIVLVVVSVTSLGDEESASDEPVGSDVVASSTSSVPTNPLEPVCAAHRLALDAGVLEVSNVLGQASAATTPDELRRLAAEGGPTATRFLDTLTVLQEELAQTPVAAAAVADRDALTTTLAELSFAFAAFTDRSLGVLGQGDPAALQAYTPEATASVAAITTLIDRVDQVGVTLGAPSCRLRPV